LRRRNHRRRRKLADGNVIWMPVRPVRPERDDDVRLYTPEVTHNRVDHLARPGAIELLIVVVEKRDIFRTEHRRRGAQLPFANRGECVCPRMLRIAWTMGTVTAAVATCRAQQEHLDAFSGVLRDSSTDAE
jgi:hypothetical protein